MQNEIGNTELFKRAISEGLYLKLQKMDKELEAIELPEPSERHKIRINRLFRECVGGGFIPYPEMDGASGK